MQVLVVLGHQNTAQTSFCHAIAKTAVETVEAAGHEVFYHDLYVEQFDPRLPQEEIPKDAPLSDGVRKSCDQLLSADAYVVIHPNWWGQPPAILKGWIDRVFRQGIAYSFGESGKVVGHLSSKKALVFTTSNTPHDLEQDWFGDPLENLWKTCIFGFCGVDHFFRRNFESIIMSTVDQRAKWLEEVQQIVNHRLFTTD